MATLSNEVRRLESKARASDETARARGFRAQARFANSGSSIRWIGERAGLD
jgi:hypothetical protein